MIDDEQTPIIDGEVTGASDSHVRVAGEITDLDGYTMHVYLLVDRETREATHARFFEWHRWTPRNAFRESSLIFFDVIAAKAIERITN